jgi:Flp pilus assembly protein TadG
MNRAVLNPLKNKRGDTLILSILVITIALLFTVLIVDFGMAFYAKTHTQSIADAMAIGGASYGNEAYQTLSTKEKVAIVNEKKAKPKAQEILNANKKYLPNGVEVVTAEMNPTGKKIDGKVMNWQDQYYSGNFTVRLTSRYNTMFLGANKNNSPFGIGLPEIRFQSEARVKVKPK